MPIFSKLVFYVEIYLVRRKKIVAHHKTFNYFSQTIFPAFVTAIPSTTLPDISQQRGLVRVLIALKKKQLSAPVRNNFLALTKPACPAKRGRQVCHPVMLSLPCLLCTSTERKPCSQHSSIKTRVELSQCSCLYSSLTFGKLIHLTMLWEFQTSH